MIELLKIILMACGVIGLATFFLTLFFSIGDHPDDRRATEYPAVDSDAFLDAIARMMNVAPQTGEEIQILNNGDGFIPVFLDTLRSAKRTINFTAYMWEPGEMSDQVMQVLLQKAKEGIEVRILLDGFGGFFAPAEKMEELTKAGGIVATFRPLKFGKLTRVHKRNHRRAIVIDGRVGFTGGMAIADHWLGGGKKQEEWRDMMFLFKGSMALSLQGAFAQLWTGTTGEILAGEKFYPKEPAKTNLETRPAVPSAEHKPVYVSAASSPAEDTAPLPNFYWFAIMCAQKNITMTYPYLIPDKFILDAMINRVKAGVKVRVLLPSKRTDAKPIRWASASYYDAFLQNGIELYEYQPSLVHTKVLTIDGKWSVIGSANMDIRSKEINEENVYGILDESFANRLEKIFEDDIKRAKRMTIEEWNKDKHRMIKFLGWLMSPFTKQY